MTTKEEWDAFDTLTRLLMPVIQDGGRKIRKGNKTPWREDVRHFEAYARHYVRWLEGEKVDLDSGSHPMVHVAFRALAIAWQEMHREGKV